MDLEATLDQAAAPDRFTQIARKCGPFAVFALWLFGLHLISRYSYLLFHSLADLRRAVDRCANA